MMQSFFHKRFEEEFLRSEQLRTKVLAGIFLFIIVHSVVMFSLFGKRVPEELKNGVIVHILIFIFSLFLFELLSFLYISRHIKLQLDRIPSFSQYLNAALEITAPSIIMLMLSGQVLTPDKVLRSPAVFIYFIFIVLSTLRLNFRISLLMGILSATEFLIVGWLLIRKAEGAGIFMSGHSEYFATIGKSMLLLLSGIGAAFVAHQIKLRVDRSLLAAEQSNKIVNLFGQQVSKEVVEEMMEKGGAVQTKIMHVCIMFIDIRNFTGYVADKTPEEIVAYQNAFFEIIVQCVIKHNGIINQFLGDGCMVTFGAPVSLSNPGTNAIHAALEIKQQLNKEIAKGNLPLTNIGIGIHEGSAVTGNIGPEIRQQYSITGSVVILAARIEQLNKQYNSQILISDSVFNKLEINIASEYIGKVNLKGWSNAVGIYKVA